MVWLDLLHQLIRNADELPPTAGKCHPKSASKDLAERLDGPGDMSCVECINVEQAKLVALMLPESKGSLALQRHLVVQHVAWLDNTSEIN